MMNMRHTPSFVSCFCSASILLLATTSSGRADDATLSPLITQAIQIGAANLAPIPAPASFPLQQIGLQGLALLGVNRELARNPYRKNIESIASSILNGTFANSQFSGREFQIAFLANLQDVEPRPDIVSYLSSWSWQSAENDITAYGGSGFALACLANRGYALAQIQLATIYDFTSGCAYPGGGYSYALQGSSPFAPPPGTTTTSMRFWGFGEYVRLETGNSINPNIGPYFPADGFGFFPLYFEALCARHSADPSAWPSFKSATFPYVANFIIANSAGQGMATTDLAFALLILELDDGSGNPPPDECRCAGRNSSGGSRIDNAKQAHIHDAVDWSASSDSSMGCSTCGGGVSHAANGDPPQLAVRRWHRYRDIGWRGSFGPGVFSFIDHQIHLYGNGSTALGTVEWFDPAGDAPVLMTNTGQAAGSFVDAVYNQVKVCRLTDSSGAPATVMSAARHAAITRWDGSQLLFEVIPAAPDIASSDGVGRFISETDRTGHVLLTVSYAQAVPASTAGTDYGDRVDSPLWQASKATDYYGTSVSFTYGVSDGQPVVTSIALPGGGAITYGYGVGRLVGLDAITYPDGSSSSFATRFDQSSNLQVISFSDAGAATSHRVKQIFVTPTLVDAGLGNGAAIATPSNYLRQVLNGAGELVWSGWSEHYGNTTSVFANESGTLMRYDTIEGSPFKMSKALTWSPSTSELTWTWQPLAGYQTDALGHLTGNTDAVGNSTAYSRDPVSGLVTGDSISGPNGSLPAETMTYDPSTNLLMQQQDRLGHLTTYQYDALGHMITRTCDSVIEHWSYDPVTGNLLSMTDPNGNVTNYTYNAANQLTATISPADVAGGNRPITQQSYDAIGRLSTTTDASNRVTTYLYDSRSRLASITYADNSTQTWTYFITGPNVNLLQQSADRNGNITTYGYDLAGRKTQEQVFGPGSQVASSTHTWTYMPGSTLVVNDTMNGNTTSYTYDVLKRVIAQTHMAVIGDTLQSTTSYDAAGRAWMTIDEQGRRTWNVYDAASRVIRTVRELLAGGLVTSSDPIAGSAALATLSRVTGGNPAYTIEDVAFDSEGRLLSRTDANGVTASFAYDYQGRMISEVLADLLPGGITNIQAAMSQYTYDNAGNRTLVTQPRSFSRTVTGVFGPGPSGPFATAFTYTGRNLLASVTEAVGQPEAATISYTYTPTGQKATETDARNAAYITSYGYATCCDRLISVTDALNHVTQFTYDANGNRLLTIDPNNHTVSMTYDALNRVVTQSNGVGDTTTISYDDDLTDGSGIDHSVPAAVSGFTFGPGAVGSAVMATNALGESTVEVHDSIGRTVRRVDAMGNASTYTYDGMVNGLQVITVTDPLGNVIQSQSSGDGKSRVSIDALGQVSLTTLDALGNALSVRDPNGVGWNAQYDAFNRLTSRTDTHGDTVSFQFDQNGNVVASIDALGNQSATTFDHRNRISTRVDRVGGTTAYAYDANNHILTMSDADGGITSYSYDQRNMLSTETFPPDATGNALVKTYGYNPGGLLITRTLTTAPVFATNPLNEATTYTYDAANRLMARSYSDGLGNDSFGYDHASRLSSAVNGRYAITVTRSYTGNSPPEKDGRLTSETVTIAGANPGTYTTTYQYDTDSRVVQVGYPTGDTQSKAYTARSQLNTVSFDAAIMATRAYDVAGRLTQTVLGNGLTETRSYRSDASGVDNYLTSMSIPGITNLTYAADANKRIASETNGQLAAQTQQYSGYDKEGRLTAWSRADGSTQTWALSKVGDWQQTVINGTSQTRSHDGSHETTQVAGATVQPIYDGKGNLTTNLNGSLYAWDSENRLASSTVTDAASGAKDTVVYRYDALGRRIQKAAFRQSTTYINDGSQVIYEFDAPTTRPSTLNTTHGNGTGTPPGGGVLQYPGTKRIDAQPWSSPIPSGFMGDFGQVYGLLDNTLIYGWTSDESANAVSCGVEIALPQFDSFIQFGTQSPAAFGSWSIGNLTPGSYAVVAVFGDAVSTNQTNNVTIQGINETDTTPAVPDVAGYPNGNFDGFAETVTVTSAGTITIGAQSTAFDPKLCFVEIGPVGSSITPADRTNLAAMVATANAATHQNQSIQRKQPTPRLYVYGSYVDEPLMMKAGANKYFYATNYLYSVAALTDSTGAVVERYKYDAYGRQGIMNTNGTVSYTPSDYGNFVGFTGRYHDWETGLVYFRVRYFDTGLGRFIGRDPAGYVDGGSLYSAYYVPNGTDPSGQFSSDNHREITNKALENLGLGSCVKTIADADVGMDNGAWRNGGDFNDSLNHGDNNRIAETIARMTQRWNGLFVFQTKPNLSDCNCADLQISFQRFGAILHALQDLYAHSTYVENNGGNPYPGSANEGDGAGGTAKIGDIPLWNMWNPDNSSNVPANVISGKYEWPRDNAPGASHAKINKDSATSPNGQRQNQVNVSNFDLAKDLATRHSRYLAQEFLARMPTALKALIGKCCK